MTPEEVHLFMRIEEKLDARKSRLDVIFKFLEVLIVPVSLGMLAYFGTLAGVRVAESQQRIVQAIEAAKLSQAQEGLDLKLVELLYQEIRNPDEKRQTDAVSLLRMMSPRVAERLEPWIQERKPQLTDGAKAKFDEVQKERRNALASKLSKYTIEIFYDEKSSEDLAEASQLKNALMGLLPGKEVSVKPQSDQASSDQVRYDPGSEDDAAEALVQLLAESNSSRHFKKQTVTTRSTNYLSIFFTSR